MDDFNAIISEIQKRGKLEGPFQDSLGNKYYMAICPFHDDHTPSLKITPRGFYCFACQKRGTLHRLAEELGIEVQEQQDNSQDNSNIFNKALRYVMQRLLLSEHEAKEFMRDYNIRPYVYQGKEGILLDLFNNTSQFRAFEGKEYRVFGKADRPAFFDLVSLLDTSLVVITEGTFDALTLLKENVFAISTSGNNWNKPNIILKMLVEQGIANVVLAFDNDEQGEEYTEKFIEESFLFGVITHVVNVAPYKDINELYMSEGREELSNRLNNAISGFDYIASRYNLETIEGKRAFFVKLIALYQQALDKVTAEAMLKETLQKHGLAYDEWLEELEKEKIYLLELEKKNELQAYLREKSKELEYKNIEEITVEISSYINNLKSVRVQTLKEKQSKILDNFKDREYISISLFNNIKLRKSDVLLITAKTKSGKTTLAMNIAKELLEEKVLYVTYEIAEEDLFILFASLEQGKEEAKLTERDIEKVIENYDGKLFIESNLSLQEIQAYVRTLRPKLFIIDYDQLVQTNGRFESEERRVAYIVSTFKHLALETNSICVLLSQVNEDGQARYSREKEFYASVHIHLEKEENSDLINYEVKLNRYGKSGSKGSLKVDWKNRRVLPDFQGVELV